LAHAGETVGAQTLWNLLSPEGAAFTRY